ncbi:DUF2971 domain-containing protein [Marinifilum sp.]|uniref:DUF2971 domain-containing protein n=1 Tax=Marinifilum sp. TaxID=2033137 RepID=UPI003BA8A43F
MILYKYLSDERIINVFEDGLLRFTPPEFFNDPFESLPNVMGAFSKELVDTLFMSVLNDSTYKWLTENVSEDSKASIERLKKIFSNGDKSIKEMYEAFRGTKVNDFSKFMKSHWNKQLGILSLSEENDNLTMWSHYANDHKGFLIGFDSNSFITQSDQILNKPKKVRYTNNRPQINLFELEESRKERTHKWSESFLYTKSKDWAYENEWRQVNKLEKSDTVKPLTPKEDLHLFKINMEAIDSIVLGCRTSPENEEKIKEYCENMSIDLFKMKTSKTCYSLERIKI